MCSACHQNGPNRIAGKPTEDYARASREKTPFSLHLCLDLQATLLLALCAENVTPGKSILKNDVLGGVLLKDCGLDFNYGGGLKGVIVRKLLERATNLLEESSHWGAFITIAHTRLVWDSRILIDHFSTVESARQWIETQRASHPKQQHIKSPKQHHIKQQQHEPLTPQQAEVEIGEAALSDMLKKMNLQTGQEKKGKYTWSGPPLTPRPGAATGLNASPFSPTAGVTMGQFSPTLGFGQRPFNPAQVSPTAGFGPALFSPMGGFTQGQASPIPGFGPRPFDPARVSPTSGFNPSPFSSTPNFTAQSSPPTTKRAAPQTPSKSTPKTPRKTSVSQAPETPVAVEETWSSNNPFRNSLSPREEPDELFDIDVDELEAFEQYLQSTPGAAPEGWMMEDEEEADE